MANRGEVFQVGEVWESPRGTVYLVIGVEGRQATLRAGVDGKGRVTRRWYDTTGRWTLRSDPKECSQSDIKIRISQIPAKVPKSVYDVIYNECEGFVDIGADPQVIWDACILALRELNGH